MPCCGFTLAEKMLNEQKQLHCAVGIEVSCEKAL